MKSYIPRRIYIHRIIPFIGKELIKVLTGQRRVGKSYMLVQIMDEIKNLDKKANIIYINKELNEFDKINEYKDLYEYVRSKSMADRMNYVFIDEIQLINKFENALKSWLAEGGYDIYCTGSNARLLSGELATLLSGRYIEIRINSLTYNEFLLFHKLENNSETLNKFLMFGGLPFLKNLDLQEDTIFDYLTNIYQAILFRDVVSRFEIRNVDFLRRLVVFLSDHTGSIISAKKISDFLKSRQVRISPSVVINYLDYLCTAFFIVKINRSDLIGKRVFETGEKYYFNDIGIRNVIVGFKPFDLSKILENVICLHMMVRGYKINTGKIGDKEVDFICEKSGEREYIQVALRIEREQTESREFGNLLKIKDNFPKYVITLDDYSGTSHKGIRHIPLRKFLSEFTQ